MLCKSNFENTIYPMELPKHLSDYPFSNLFHQLRERHKRFIINYGGTAAGKSYSAAQKEVIYSAEHPVKTLVIRKVGNTLRDSVIPSFRARIEELGYAEQFTYNKTDRTLTCKENGAQIVFRGLDDPDKLKSFEGLTRILVEEAAELEFEDFLELNRRTRGKENIQITLTFNPVDEEHWLKKHFFDRENPDADIIHSTYKNNNHLTEQDREQIEQLKEYDNNHYRVYALGEWGVKVNNAPWLYTFDKERHVVDSLPVLEKFPVHLSFDFNRDPLTCIAVQMSSSRGRADSFIHIVREFSGRYTLEEICLQVKATFGSSSIFVTGDASGRRGDISMEDRNATYYKLIQNYLGLADRQMNLFTRNMPHADSRMLINTLLAGYPKISISLKDCPLLVNDCVIAQVDDTTDIPGALRKDRKVYKMDLFDCMRYFFQQYFADYAGMIPLGKRAA